jgi:hypothetical protein
MIETNTVRRPTIRIRAAKHRQAVFLGMKSTVGRLGLDHKVLTYVEFRAVSGVFQNIDPPPPLHPASVSSPRNNCGGRTQSLGGEGVGGQYLDIGLASYSIINLSTVGTNIRPEAGGRETGSKQTEESYTGRLVIYHRGNPYD